MDKERAIEVFIAETLKDSVKVFFEGRELSDEDKEILISLLRVIQYMSIHPDYKNYYSQNKELIDIALGTGKIGPNEFTVTCVKENVDGSANIEVEMGEGVRKSALDAGINFLLIKAILGGTTEDILQWAQLGKQIKALG